MIARKTPEPRPYWLTAGLTAPREPASVKLMEMMDRPVAVADAETVGSRDRRADPGLGIAHGRLEILTLGKARGDRRGQRAAGAMGVAGRDARRGERDRAVSADEIVDALGALAVPALDQHCAAAERQQTPPLAFDLGLASRDRRVQQCGGLRQIRRDHRRERISFVRNASTASAASRRSPEVATITGSSTTWLGVQRDSARSNRVDARGLRHHADLHRADVEIGEHRVDLRGDEFGGHRMNAGDALVFCAVSAVIADAP